MAFWREGDLWTLLTAGRSVLFEIPAAPLTMIEEGELLFHHAAPLSLTI